MIDPEEESFKSELDKLDSLSLKFKLVSLRNLHVNRY